MRSKIFTPTFLTVLCILLASRAAAADQDPGWRLKLNLAALQPTSGGGFDPGLGGGLALEYRATPRLGFEVSAWYADFESEVEVDAIVASSFTAVSKFDATPVLAKVNWHLTPGKRADLYVGPVAGWVRYSDVKLSFKGPIAFLDLIPVPDIETADSFAWGAHAGLDLPVGNGRSFFTAGLTYLVAEVEHGIVDQPLFDLDPLAAHVGFGFRF